MAKIEYYNVIGNGSIEGLDQLLKDVFKQQILQADDRASSARRLHQVIHCFRGKLSQEQHQVLIAVKN